ncbi:MAG: VCBS repeat-containing protein [Labilithrix sp.]|nr:VCBS repeat-containing protein [Labilithrix sp.]
MRAAVLRTTVVSLAALALAWTASGSFLACGVPDNFDGLVGGAPPDAGPDGDAPPIDLRPDTELPPPRPIAPLSLSWIDGTRPRFEWQLASSTTGARVELCRTRACDGETKSIDAAGTTLALDEDLAPGLWFWRLVSRTPESFGTKPGPTWALLVRGGPAKKDASSGSLVDLNGDGRSDLLVTVEYDSAPGASFIELVALLANNDDSTSFVTAHGDRPVAGVILDSPDPPIAAIDIDGDGLSDLVFADVYGTVTPTPVLVTVPGSATARDGLDLDRSSLPNLPPLDSSPNLAALGDLDRDGWGDVAVTTKRFGVAAYGTASGLGALNYVIQVDPFWSADGGAPPEQTQPFSVAGAFDRDADGFADLALEAPEGDIGLIVFQGAAPRQLTLRIPKAPDGPATKPARAFASGDFDGDGLGDVAFVTTVNGSPAVCLVRGSDSLDAMRPICWTPASPSAGFASSVTAGDVDADGRDELVVGSSDAGIDVLALDAAGKVAVSHLDTAFGARLTTVFPGRPGPAVWAATRADGSAIGVFKGKALATTLTPAFGAKRFGATIR